MKSMARIAALSLAVALAGCAAGATSPDAGGAWFPPYGGAFTDATKADAARAAEGRPLNAYTSHIYWSGPQTHQSR